MGGKRYIFTTKGAKRGAVALQRGSVLPVQPLPGTPVSAAGKRRNMRTHHRRVSTIGVLGVLAVPPLKLIGCSSEIYFLYMRKEICNNAFIEKKVWFDLSSKKGKPVIGDYPSLIVWSVLITGTNTFIMAVNEQFLRWRLLCLSWKANVAKERKSGIF